ncbi:hypothetical protein PRBEI_2001678900 [Prionailurus iriomotensis]
MPLMPPMQITATVAESPSAPEWQGPSGDFLRSRQDI